MSKNSVLVNNGPMIHVRYDGQSWDFPLSELDVGSQSTDQQIRETVAMRLNVPATKLSNFVIDRNLESGDMTLRPEAVFG